MKQFNYYIYIYIHIISFRITLMDLGYLGSRNYVVGIIGIFYTMQPTNPNAVT